MRDIIRSLTRTDYVYKCSDAPIVGVCKRTPCKKQEYGTHTVTSVEHGDRAAAT